MLSIHFCWDNWQGKKVRFSFQPCLFDVRARLHIHILYLKTCVFNTMPNLPSDISTLQCQGKIKFSVLTTLLHSLCWITHLYSFSTDIPSLNESIHHHPSYFDVLVNTYFWNFSWHVNPHLLNSINNNSLTFIIPLIICPF